VLELLVRTLCHEQHLAKEALQKAFDEIKKSEDRLRLVIDTIPTLVWRADRKGASTSSINHPRLHRPFTGPSRNWLASRFHPDDKKGMLVKWSAYGSPVCEAGLKLGFGLRW